MIDRRKRMSAEYRIHGISLGQGIWRQCAKESVVRGTRRSTLILVVRTGVTRALTASQIRLGSYGAERPYPNADGHYPKNLSGGKVVVCKA